MKLLDSSQMVCYRTHALGISSHPDLRDTKNMKTSSKSRKKVPEIIRLAERAQRQWERSECFTGDFGDIIKSKGDSSKLKKIPASKLKAPKNPNKG